MSEFYKTWIIEFPVVLLTGLVLVIFGPLGLIADWRGWEGVARILSKFIFNPLDKLHDKVGI